MYKKNIYSRYSGFTLIELSIVLVIIGLIVGGVLVGQDLIRAAQLRSIITEADAYKSAVFAFKTKYNCLAGDCPNATDYFGAKADCSDRTEFTKTCNGNNDSKISYITSTVTTGNDVFLFWQHLALAGLISGKFNGVEGVLGVQDIDAGVNAPTAKIEGGAWGVSQLNATTLSSPTHHFKIDFGNHFAFGIPDSAINGFTRLAILTPMETYNIDQKIDDGKPAKGRFTVRFWSLLTTTTHLSTSCTNAVSDSDFAADYNLSNTAISCVPRF